MISHSNGLAWVSTAPPPPAESGSGQPATAVQQWLPILDNMVVVLGLACLLAVIVAWLIRSRRDPLAAAPVRVHDLREDAVALPVLVYMMAAVIVSTAVNYTLGDAEGPLARTVINYGTQLAGIAACLAVASGRFEGGLRRFLFGEPATPDAAAGRSIATWLGWVGGVTLVSLGLCPIIHEAAIALVHRLMPDHVFRSHPTVQWMRDPDQSRALYAALWIGAALLAPIAEELFFRGILQSALARLLRCRWSAVALTSLAFGAVHYEQLDAVPALAVLAVLLGFAYERTGRLTVPIAIHAAFNLKTLIWASLSP